MKVFIFFVFTSVLVNNAKGCRKTYRRLQFWTVSLLYLSMTWSFPLPKSSLYSQSNDVEDTNDTTIQFEQNNISKSSIALNLNKSSSPSISLVEKQKFFQHDTSLGQQTSTLNSNSNDKKKQPTINYDKLSYSIENHKESTSNSNDDDESFDNETLNLSSTTHSFIKNSITETSTVKLQPEEDFVTENEQEGKNVNQVDDDDGPLFVTEISDIPVAAKLTNNSKVEFGGKCEKSEECAGMHRQCRLSMCKCEPGYMFRDNACALAKEQPIELPKTDPTMIGVVIALVAMSIILCVVLRLFAKARFRENRTIFNTPNPRLMNVSLMKGSKSQLRGNSGQQRRGSVWSMVSGDSRRGSIRSAQGSRHGSTISLASNQNSPSTSPTSKRRVQRQMSSKEHPSMPGTPMGHSGHSRMKHQESVTSNSNV